MSGREQEKSRKEVKSKMPRPTTFGKSEEKKIRKKFDELISLVEHHAIRYDGYTMIANQLKRVREQMEWI